MQHAEANSLPNLGFLTVVEQPQSGLLGGYLITNLAGRPLEFHCTAPMKPNRAQEILYGPTLRPYLYGETIGRALVRQAKQGVQVILTDCSGALAVRSFVREPVALVCAGPVEAVPGAGQVNLAAAGKLSTEKIFPADSTPDGELLSFALSGQLLAVDAQHEQDRQAVCERLGKAAERLDLSEPFQRIRDAICEAEKSAA